MGKNDVIAKVAILLPFDRLLDYRIPAELEQVVRIGTRVLVPLGPRKVTGCVVGIEARSGQEVVGSDEKPFPLRDVVEVLDEEPLFGPEDLVFYRWIAEYYCAPLGEVIRAVLPVAMNVRTSQVVRLLPQGRAFANAGLFLGRTELEILQLLAQHGELPLRKLQKLLKRRVKTSVLEELQRKGLLETDMVLKRPRAAKDSKGHASPGPFSLQGAGCNSDSRAHPPYVLTQGQEQARRAIVEALHKGQFAPFLLYGVTGSGKTEVYIQAIEEALTIGKQGLVLVPEIALTPQTVRRFSERLRSEVTVLHSGLTQKERLHHWWKIRKGEVSVVIGARSAVFAPFRNLGIIVIDEEHDTSYKQEDRVRYHARDVALVRAKHTHAVAILGSATPSLESYHNARTGKFTLLELTERVESRSLPEVVIVNMTDPANRLGSHGAFSTQLVEGLRTTLREGRQAIVLLNRRGFSHTLVCRDCGFLFRCPNCSVTLTYHLAVKRLCCHYCEHHAPVPEQCPGCHSTDIEPVGRGTERIEKELSAVVGITRVARMDRDTTRRRGSHEEILRRFRQGEIDVLIGTQMIAKGHDIPTVTCVGVLAADVSLDLPDFRAAERTFQLLTQVAGRAGRGPWPGKVFIQTLHPDSYCIKAVKEQDYKLFYSQEIAFRKELLYPPYSRMVLIRVRGAHEGKTREVAKAIAQEGRKLVSRHADRYLGSIQILGPSSAPLARLRGQYRFHCVIKGTRPKLLNLFIKEFLNLVQSTCSDRAVRIDVDVDPLQVL